jgi:hypothetical protein
MVGGAELLEPRVFVSQSVSSTARYQYKVGCFRDNSRIAEVSSDRSVTERACLLASATSTGVDSLPLLGVTGFVPGEVVVASRYRDGFVVLPSRSCRLNPDAAMIAQM